MTDTGMWRGTSTGVSKGRRSPPWDHRSCGMYRTECNDTMHLKNTFLSLSLPAPFLRPFLIYKWALLVQRRCQRLVLRSLPQSHSTLLFFQTGSVAEPGPCRLSQTDRTVSYRGVHYCAGVVLCRYWGSELRSSCFRRNTQPTEPSPQLHRFFGTSPFKR